MFFVDTEGFRAFDGSDRYFKRLGLYDADCCYLGDRNTISNPDDGYFIVERLKDCGCCPTRCVVVESARWYAANGYHVGATVDCPLFAGADNPRNSATWRAVYAAGGPRDACCNYNGDKIYMELTEEIGDSNPLP